MGNNNMRRRQRCLQCIYIYVVYLSDKQQCGQDIFIGFSSEWKKSPAAAAAAAVDIFIYILYVESLECNLSLLGDIIYPPPAMAIHRVYISIQQTLLLFFFLPPVFFLSLSWIRLYIRNDKQNLGELIFLYTSLPASLFLFLQ